MANTNALKKHREADQDVHGHRRSNTRRAGTQDSFSANAKKRGKAHPDQVSMKNSDAVYAPSSAIFTRESRRCTGESSATYDEKGDLHGKSMP